MTSGVGCKEPVLGALKAEVNVMLGGTDVAGFVSECVNFAKKNRSLPHRVGAAKCRVAAASVKTGAAARKFAAHLLLEEDVWSGRGLTLKNVIDALKVRTYLPHTVSLIPT